jgi:branched-chain amino acid transport system ATP-binding protein
MSGGAVLSARDVSTGYSGQPVVSGLSLAVSAGQVVCLLGPNGAGKTSSLLALAGELPLMSGEVAFNGAPTKLPLHRRARQGLSFVTEERSIFKSLSCRDNLRAGRVDVEAALSIFPELRSRLSVRAGLLSGGEQQMLTLARALGRRPSLLLADELSLGLAPLVVEKLLSTIRAAADQGAAVLIVEQHARKALAYADWAVVLRNGQVEMSVPADEARARLSDIEDAYLSGAAPST